MDEQVWHDGTRLVREVAINANPCKRQSRQVVEAVQHDNGLLLEDEKKRVDKLKLQGGVKKVRDRLCTVTTTGNLNHAALSPPTLSRGRKNSTRQRKARWESVGGIAGRLER